MYLLRTLGTILCFVGMGEIVVKILIKEGPLTPKDISWGRYGIVLMFIGMGFIAVDLLFIVL